MLRRRRSWNAYLKNVVYNTKKGTNIKLFAFRIQSTKTATFFDLLEIILGGILHKTNKCKARLHMLVWCKLVENDLEKIETCRSLSGLYMKAYILMSVPFFLALHIKLLINAHMWIILTHLNIHTDRMRKTLAVSYRTVGLQLSAESHYLRSCVLCAHILYCTSTLRLCLSTMS